jgi:glycosyltransferase involved in cell wall biosynthesis
MPDFFACSDVLLVSLKNKRIFALTIPAKIQSYLACSKPIVGAVDGEGAKIIEEAKAGFIASSGDTKSLVVKILKLYNMDKIQRESLGKNGRRYYMKNFEREMLISKLLDIFNR